MHNFTNRLTNGIFVPGFKIHEDNTDTILKSVLKYLGEFIFTRHNQQLDIKSKIKLDFDLLTKFNGFKQTQAYFKIKKTLEEAMGDNPPE